MALSQQSASVLLASFILLLLWTTSSAQSNNPSSDGSVDPLPSRRREKVAASLVLVKDTLTVVKEAMAKVDTKTMSNLMKGFASFFSLIPGIGGFVFSIVNVALAFVPQEDKTLAEVKNGFAEVNQKLESLSMQISNLATDVEWFNYASMYSRDELRILNAWRKFNEFRENSQEAQSEEEKLRLAEIFTNYYEYTGTEASVANFFHYLTVDSTSLSKNLNDLLKRKFKCDINEISKYNFYFSSLLWRGMVLNQLYWRLIGFTSSNREAEHIQMFQKVYRTQIAAVEFCMDKYDGYMEEDVEEITKAIDPGNKGAIARRVETKLSEKYFWYNWAVLVYDTEEEGNYILHSMKNFTIRKIKVAVGHTTKPSDEINRFGLRDYANLQVAKCYKEVFQSYQDGSNSYLIDKTPCATIKQKISQCNSDDGGVPLNKSLKFMFTTKKQNLVGGLTILTSRSCDWDGSNSRLYIAYSPTLHVCSDNTCAKEGECKRMLDSNDYRCECHNGWHGDRCETPLDPKAVPQPDIARVVPDITTVNAKLNLMDAKLEEILTAVQN